MSRNPTVLTWTDPETDETHTLPSELVLCPTCRGKGTSSAYLGAFTQEDREQMSHDEWDDYMGGCYDRTCEQCNGLRVIAVLDEDRARRVMPEVLAAFLADEEDERGYQAMVAAERRYGC